MTRRQLNYMTVVPARRTLAECQDILADAGADAVAVIYSDRQPSGISFQLITAGGKQTYLMPVRHASVAKKLRQDYDAGLLPSVRAMKGGKTTLLSEQHARDVAWRVVRDWLDAQLSLIATEMVSLDEVMMPYLQIEPGVSLYQALTEGRAAIGPGTGA